MKITKKQLEKLIKEAITQELQEGPGDKKQLEKLVEAAVEQSVREAPVGHAAQGRFEDPNPEAAARFNLPQGGAAEPEEVVSEFFTLYGYKKPLMTARQVGMALKRMDPREKKKANKILEKMRDLRRELIVTLKNGLQ